MDVVFDASHANDRTFETIADLAEMGMESAANVDILKHGKAMFGGEDEVDTDSGEGLGHNLILSIGAKWRWGLQSQPRWG